DFMKGVLRR
ncbi:Phosphoenolpyruvate-protein phosphotransferase, partial [Haemophilus influenzae]